MTQTLLFIGCYLAGLTMAVAFGLGRDAKLAAALAFPMGFGALVLEQMIVLPLSLPYSGWTLAGCLVMTSGIAAIGAILGKSELPPVRPLALMTALFAVVAILAGSVNHARLSYDSHQLLYQAQMVGFFEAPQWEAFGFWGSFMVVAHSMMHPTDAPFLFGLAPMFAFSTAAIFFVILRDMLRANGGAAIHVDTRRVWLLTFALVLTTAFALHALYIHTNLPSATYLTAFVGLFWLAETRGSRRLVYAALFMLLCFSLMRLESPLVACTFLVLTVFVTEKTSRELAGPVLGFALVLAGWLAILAGHLPDDSKFLTRSQALVLCACVVAFSIIGLLIHHPPLSRLRRYVPRLAITAAIAAAGATLAINPEHMISCGEAMFYNLFTEWYWSAIWWLLPIGALLSCLTPATSARIPDTLRLGPWLFFAVTFVLGFARDPYRVGIGDSANRMALHVFPLLLLYLGARFIPVARRSPSGSD